MESFQVEITDNQYLIRLQRSDFDLNSLYLLIKGLGAQNHYLHRLPLDLEDDMIKNTRNGEDVGDRFDHLLDK